MKPATHIMFFSIVALMVAGMVILTCDVKAGGWAALCELAALMLTFIFLHQIKRHET